MEFCEECGSMMTPEDDYWVCDSCGHEQGRDAEKEAEMVTTQGQEESEVIDTSEVEDTGRPTTRAECPECDNDQAYWYMQQIRAADESETRFLECTECEHKWRQDDH
jgi:DNA-directed RNA polymerase subunit M